MDCKLKTEKYKALMKAGYNLLFIILLFILEIRWP